MDPKMAARIGNPRALLAALVVLCINSVAFSQLREAVTSPVQPAGYARHTCGADRFYCDDCLGKNGPSASPSPSNGQFVAPQASGTVKGGGNSVGVEGMSLHFPALTLRLPSLHLPHMFRLRKGARMLMDPSTAPYVEHSPRSQVLGAIPAVSIPPNSPPQDSPSNSPPSQQNSLQRSGQKSVSVDANRAHALALERLRQREAEIERMGRQIERLERAMQQLAQTPTQGVADCRQASLLAPVAWSPTERVRPAVLVTPHSAKPLSFSLPASPATNRLVNAARKPRLERFPATTVR